MKQILNAFNDWQKKDIERLKKEQRWRRRRNDIEMFIVFLVFVIVIFYTFS